MVRRLIGLAGALALLLFVGVGAPAQDRKDRDFKTPKTPLEAWDALQYEVESGRYDLAGLYLRELTTRMKPSADDFLTIHKKEGSVPLLTLRRIRVWYDDPKRNAEAKADAKKFVEDYTAAVRQKLLDPNYIRQNLDALTATPEERAFALEQLYPLGGEVVPYFVDRLRRSTDARERALLLDALGKMGPDTVPPLLAVFDSNDAILGSDVLDILRRRHVRQAAEIVPHLWFPSASPKQPAPVRAKARAVLADFQGVKVDHLPPARSALTRLAEQYYNHRVRFPDPDKVVVWRWDGAQVVKGWPGSPTINANQAEEHWGLRFARQALDLDPADRPAQVVFLSLALDKAMEKAGPLAPLSVAQPAIYDLLARSSGELLIDVLDRALREKRSTVVLAITRVLGDRVEARARLSGGSGEPALVRALDYPDRRIQVAAAEALLRIPGERSPQVKARIVEILGRLLRSDVMGASPRRFILAVKGEVRRELARQALESTGASVLLASTGRQALRQLRLTDVAAIVVDSDVTDPTLAVFLGNLRADRDVKGIPVLLSAVPEGPEVMHLSTRTRRLRERLDIIRKETREYDILVREARERLSEKLDEILTAKRYAKLKEGHAQEIKAGVRAAYDRTDVLARDARERYFQQVSEALTAGRYGRLEPDRSRQIDTAAEGAWEDRAALLRRFPAAAPLLRERKRINEELDRIVEVYDLAARTREEQLKKFTARDANISVVPPELLLTGAELSARLNEEVRDKGVTLTPAELKAHSEIAMRILAGMARGVPKGYDVSPVMGSIRTALRDGKLSPDVQMAAISALGTVPGAETQADLAAVIFATPSRPLPVRMAATDELLHHTQKHGVRLNVNDLRRLRELRADEKTSQELRDRLVLLEGVLRPGDRATGEGLRRYEPRIVAPLPPPKEKEKEKDEKGKGKGKD